MLFAFVEDLSYIKVIHTLQSYGANINHVAVTQLPGNTKPTKFTDIYAKSLISIVCDRAQLELHKVGQASNDESESSR